MNSHANIAITLDSSAGFATLQDGHHAIADMLDRLQAAVISGAGRDVILPIVDALGAFTECHVANQENADWESGTPVEAHLPAHREFLERLRCTRALAQAEDVALATLDAVDILHDLDKHIDTCSSGYQNGVWFPFTAEWARHVR